MLRVTQQDNAAAAKDYYSKADYYTDGQEIIGRWSGRAAQMLGLDGTVDKDAFDRLCDNLDPRTDKKLTVRTKGERTVGYDFTFSVPKSVSLLYTMTGDGQILDAFRSAIDETMRDIESEMQTRVRKGGKNENRETGNMVWAEFIHTTSRPVDGEPDPQLHAHCFAFNATFCDQEQRWKAGQFRELKRDAPYFQAAFRVRLAGKLQDLGFETVRKRDDFEIAGLPPALLKKFSRRTEEVEKAYEQLLAKRLAKLGHGEFSDGKLMVAGVEQSREQVLMAAEQLGISDTKRKAELGEETREKKSHEKDWNELRAAWHHRMSEEERNALVAAYRRVAPRGRGERGEGAAVDHAISHCFVRDATVPERTLLTEALKRGIGAVTVDGVKKELGRRSLIRGLWQGRATASTWEMKRLEGRVVGVASGGRGRHRPFGDAERPFTRDWLNDGQKGAVAHVLSSRDAVTIIRGAAGTGKTTLEEELGEALAEAGHTVVALAPTTGAVNELRTKAGFPTADTLARFLKDERMQHAARGGVVLVDEAGLIGTRDMVKLFDAAQGAGARVVLVGDRRQNRPVAAGEPLKLLEERAGLPVAEVTEILRQSGDYKKVTEALTRGDTAAGFAELDRLGWIKEIPGGERERATANAYLAATAERKKDGEYKSALTVSTTWAEVGRLTAAIRAALKKEGRLGEERILPVWLPAHLTDPQKADATNYDPGDLLQFFQNAPGHVKGSRLVAGDAETLPLQHADRFAVYRPAQLTVAVRDRIRVTANGKTKDGKHGLRNGMLLTVQGFTAKGDVIVDKGWVIAKDWGHLAHGYGVTSEGGQGKDVDKVFVGLSRLSFGATNQRRTYVFLTRGKEQAVVFTDDKEELLRVVQRKDEPLSATELAESRAPKRPLRQRLKKLLAYRNRCATFAQTHDGQRPERAVDLRREMTHAR